MPLLTKVCLSILVIPIFLSGWLYRHISLIDGSRECIDKIVKIDKSKRIKKYFGHKSIKDMGNVYNHAESLYETEWAKCFRQELYK